MLTTDPEIGAFARLYESRVRRKADRNFLGFFGSINSLTLFSGPVINTTQLGPEVHDLLTEKILYLCDLQAEGQKFPRRKFMALPLLCIQIVRRHNYARNDGPI